MTQRKWKKERRVIIEEINMTYDQPADWVHQLIDEVMWGEQPLGRDIAGSIQTVSQISREDLARLSQAPLYPGKYCRFHCRQPEGNPDDRCGRLGAGRLS
ncbi:MAG: hypothetical protein KatS3mg057_2366 [Herpetosiphonaceae bacterium]|nr:MAG: hypothetical protein KatS3mg057_2366 [Herpetosiphonaceae bacterium]